MEGQSERVSLTCNTGTIVYTTTTLYVASLIGLFLSLKLGVVETILFIDLSLEHQSTVNSTYTVEYTVYYA